MTTVNTALALQLLIDLTLQVQRLGQVLKTAQDEGRDVNKDDLVVLRREDDLARKRLQDWIDSHPDTRDMTQFKQPDLDKLHVNPLTGETAAENLARAENIAAMEEAKRVDTEEKKQREIQEAKKFPIRPA